MSFKQVKLMTFLCLAAAGCSTPQKAPQREPKKSSKSQKGSKAAQAQMAAQMNAARNTTEELVTWVVRMSNPANAFSMKDRQYVESLPGNPKPGSISEAALAVGLLRGIMTPPGGTAAFKDVDAAVPPPASQDNTSVLPKPAATVNTASALERRSREKGLDIVSALSNNTVLKNAAVFTWAWNASLLEGNSEPFRQNLEAVIKGEAMLWQEISSKMIAPQVAPAPTLSDTQVQPPATNDANSQSGAAAAAAIPGTSLPEGLATGAGAAAVTNLPNPDTSHAASPSQATPESIAEGNAALGRAQEAAQAENYAKAVEEAAKVPPSSPNYTIAQDNVRLWSNRAVTDLRKKAAFEYRSSTSIADPNAKKAFLKKAQGYLEDAIKNFPNASNLDTVQENLKMITSELGS